MERLKRHIYSRYNYLIFESDCARCGRVTCSLSTLEYGFLEDWVYCVGDRMERAPDGLGYNAGDECEDRVVVQGVIMETRGHADGCSWRRPQEMGQCAVLVVGQVIREVCVRDTRYSFAPEALNGVVRGDYVAPYLVLGDDGAPLRPGLTRR